MIYIFHGDNIESSRTAWSTTLNGLKDTQVLRLDSKTYDLDNLNQFLQSQDMFGSPKVLAFSNLFSIPKANLDKIIKLLICSPISIFIWQDKLLTATQLKILPQAKVNIFKTDNSIFKCIKLVQPGKFSIFLPPYQKVISQGLYDLFLYLLKGNLRRQLQTSSRFPADRLKKTYLYLIELDYQNKSGQLSIPCETALERILFNLMR